MRKPDLVSIVTFGRHRAAAVSVIAAACRKLPTRKCPSDE
jgi:hypothetical protein